MPINASVIHLSLNILKSIVLVHVIHKKNFCGVSMGRNQYWAGRVYDLCVYYMTGTPEGSTESGFMEKPGIEPATPGCDVLLFFCQ